MTTQDITRHLLQPGKHYAGARMQQGRTVLDSDWNEDAMLEAEDLRAMLAELAGSHGSPNAGFSISNVQAVFQPTADGLTPEDGLTFDFTIAPGSMFVGGLRVELEQAEQFLDQSDWPRIDEVFSNLPYRPLAEDLELLTDKVRYDLVYLHVWEQTVSMVEDRELRERALGGPDTTTRVRRMRRVELLTDVGSDRVEEAFAVLVAELESEGATFDVEHAELVSNARITVQAITNGPANACEPTLSGGYLGNEHQAIRVELRGPKSFTWGFCNAAPLHRVRLLLPSGPIISGPVPFEFITAPHDQVARPRVGQIVELLSWSAKLPNDEHVAELTGPLFRITSVQDRVIMVDNPLPLGMGEWMNANGGNERHFYLRIWDRGPDVASPVEIPFLEGVPVPLGYTGLQVAFRPGGRIGDHWVVAARKGASARLLPWELLDGAAPHGTRHFHAPLAIIRWDIPEEVLNSDFPPGIPSIRDIRRRLRPLCRSGCCTIHVGDGVNTFGQVDSLADAIALLPISGGRICLLDGQHEGDVEIVGRSNIEIVGCGPQTRLINADAVTPAADIATAGPPLLRLTDCTDIVIRNFTITADASVGIAIRNSTGQSERIRLDHLQFSTDGTATIGVSHALPQAAVLALGCNDLDIQDCRVDVENLLNYMPAIVVGGTGIRLHRNWVQVGALDNADAPAMGGIHVLSQSSDVELIGNVVRNGWGNGITLGHVRAVEFPEPAEETPLADIWAAAERGVGEALTEHLGWVPVMGAPEGELESGEVWSPLGAITDLRIRDNQIQGMSLSAISTVFPVAVSHSVCVVVVINADIQGNRLIGNAQITGLDVAIFSDFYYGIGGVSLGGSISATIRENLIRDHGSGYEIPVCGIAALAAQNLVITDNHIVDNGASAPAETLVDAKGQRGGVVVLEACAVRGYTFADSAPDTSVPPPPLLEFGHSETAVFMHHNEISQRIGKALLIGRGFGPIVVTENSLHSLGDPIDNMEIEDSALIFTLEMEAPLSRPARGACVEIVNLASSSEVDYGEAALPTTFLTDTSSAQITDGRVLFCGNHTQLAWWWPGGYASSVLISSLDSVVVNHNTMTVSMGNTLSMDGGFIPNVFDNPTTTSFLLVNCWVGASSTTQATGNRFEEGLADVFLSHLAADAISAHGAEVSEVHNALLATMNVGTHCVTGKPAGTHQALFADNIAVHTVAFGSGCDPDIDFAGGPPQTITVHIP